MEPEPRKNPLRFHEIDLLRFLAALSVVFYHYTYRAWAANHYSAVTYPKLGEITRYGYLGVELFFMISGYVVLMSAYGKTVRQFFISRVIRLYPAFWVACTLTYIIVKLFGPQVGTWGWSTSLEAKPIEYVVNMTMLQSFLGVEDIDSAYWSLAPEIAFYFLVSLLIAGNQMRKLPLILLGWLLYTVVVHPLSTAPSSYLLLPKSSPYFISGMLFYLIQNKLFPARQLYTLLTISFCLALRSAYVNTNFMAAFVFHDAFHFRFVATVILSFYLIFYSVITRKINLSNFPWLARVGALTYPLYLLHSSIGYVIYQRVGDSVNKYILLACLLLLMLTLAYTVNILVEKRYSKRLGNLTNRLLDAV
jgi:peptidoglycan/LPS O-acetylase OafA/YrhL